MFSNVHTMRPRYADYDSPAKFLAIQSIITKRLIENPNACCSYSGGSDSDIMLDMIEKVRELYKLPPVMYFFYNTGLEMQAIKDHVRAQSEKYGVKIIERRPKKNIVMSVREHGVPFISKIISSGIEQIQLKNIPIQLHEEYNNADDKTAKRAELKARYPKCESVLNFLCCCNSRGEPRPDIQLVINSSKYLYEFFKDCGLPDFKISCKCCEYCKKQPARQVEKDFDMIITGERREEGGVRSVPRKGEENATMCFAETANNKYRLRPLFYVSDKDKEWYKNYYDVEYSAAYSVYGLKRTGCCGCSISYRAVDDLEMIGKYEPKLKTAAWNVFGKSYELRQKYNEYKAWRMREDKGLAAPCRLGVPT